MFWLYLYRISTTPLVQEKIEAPFEEAVRIAELRMQETSATSARLVNIEDKRSVWRKYGSRNS